MSAASAAGARRPQRERRRAADSAFEASAFERSLGGGSSMRWIGWRRRILALLALLGCLGVFALARWLAATPELDARWAAGPHGELVLRGSPDPALQALRGHALVAIGAPGLPESPASALLLHRSPRWQPDDALRREQLAQQRALAAALAAAGSTGTLQLRFDDGSEVDAGLAPLGYARLGAPFWPLAAVALLLYLFAIVLLLARPRRRTLLFVIASLCQCANLLFIAIQGASALGRIAVPLAGHMALLTSLDLCTAAAIVHAFALHPRRLPQAPVIAIAAWGAVPAWWALSMLASQGMADQLWWWAQGACVALGLAALAVIDHSHRVEPNPYALVMRRFAAAALAALLLTTLVVALATHTPIAARVALVAAISWSLFFAALLLLTPFLARSRQLLREFALLAAVSTVATSLDLLFAAVFSLGPFASLAFAVFVALGLYAGARQWVISHMLHGSMLTTERTFDRIYRAAREVQTRPSHYQELLGQLLRDLFEPLELLRVDRVPPRARVLGGGAALVVPLRAPDDDAAPATAALVLRFAQRGHRLFTLDDARLADRVVEQLRRAKAYDQAVERGRFEERQRIAQDLHDDIGARLLTLMYQAPSPEMEQYIRHTLQDLKTLTRGLAAAEHRLSHAAAEWKADLTQRLIAANVNLGWSLSHDRDLRLSVVEWSALTRVLRELVSNALYHGHAGRIDIDLTLDGSRLRLLVTDDGCGRRPQDWSHGLGLGGVRKRVKLLGGEVSWRENEPRGIACEVLLADFGSPA